MTDLLASFQINPTLPALAAVVPLRAAPVSPPAGAVPTLDFGATIAGLIGPTHRSPDGETLQDDAAGGKNLPQPGDVTPDPSIIWLPGAIVPPDQQAAPVSGAVPAEKAASAELTSSPTPATRALITANFVRPDGSDVSQPGIARLPDPLAGDPMLMTPLPAAAATTVPNGGQDMAQPTIPLPSLAPGHISTDSDNAAVTAVPQSMPPSPAPPIKLQAGINPGTIAVSAQPSESIASAAPDQHKPLLTPATASPIIVAPLDQPTAVDSATPASAASITMAPHPQSQLAASPIQLLTPATAAPASVTLDAAPVAASSLQQPQPATAPAQPNAPALVAQTGSAPVQAPAAAAQATPDAVLAAPDEVGNQPATRFAHTPMMREAAPQPALVPLAPQAALPVALTSGAAAQVFATALSTAPVDLQRRSHAAEPELLLAGMVPVEQRQVVQAMSQAAPGTLDLANDDWSAQMIDRIAALRDAAEAADTRIKLAPENLGALEVSIRRDGERIHVHFTAENAAARQLIADAAPRLSELADARGVKLGQTSVDGGEQQGSQRDAQHQQQSQLPARNVTVAAHSDPATDERIA